MIQGHTESDRFDGPDRAGSVRLAPGVDVPRRALRMSAVRSSGPGGQNVNKVATKVELRIALSDLQLHADAMERLVRSAGRRITASGELVLSCQKHRSQALNREECVEMLRRLVGRSLIAPKQRTATKPTRGSKARRREGKRRHSELKKTRRRPQSHD